MNIMRNEVKTIQNDLEYLRQISKEVDFENDDWMEALQKLNNFCKNDDNILAIASIQLGIPLRLIYIKKSKLDKFDDSNYNESRILINPVIIKKEGLTTYWEACASCLDNMGLVQRPYKIEVEFFNDKKEKIIEIFEGFEATVLSHEMDHLDGILHIDKSIEILQMGKEERKKYRESHPYQIIRKEGAFLENEEKIKKM